MRIDEIMMGDWVLMDEQTEFPMQIEGIFANNTVYLNFEGNEGDVFEVDVADVQPIPMTEEIAKASGYEPSWQYTEEDRCRTYSKVFNPKLTVYLCYFEERWIVRYEDDREHLISLNIQYVHELQQELRKKKLFDVAKEFKV